jgi:ATP-dependent DNA helicase DinG
MKTTERFTVEVINTLRAAITDAGGNEVFCVGVVDKEKKVHQVTIAARGTKDTVPALAPYMEKGDVVIHNHPSGFLQPSGADLGIASQLGDNGVGFYIINNQVDEIYAVAEPIAVKELKPLDIDLLAALLEPEGKLQEIFKSYEERPSQVEMLKQVATAFNQDYFCVAEAGTGVGKSLAYLIPAIEWACLNEERVVISTATINLQQQLLEKDIPLVMKLLDRFPKVILAKGRGNYLCHNRMVEALEEETLFDEANREFAAIKAWATNTETGDISDLSFSPSQEVWSLVCSEADFCHGLRCTHREHCFILKARREAASAQLLIVNHHLFFSDVSVRLGGLGFEKTAVLPPFQRIIFDEAHNIEASATSFFSDSFSRHAIKRNISRFYHQKKGRGYGLIFFLEKFLATAEQGKIRQVPELVRNLLEKAELLDYLSLQLLGEEGNLLLKPGQTDNLTAPARKTQAINFNDWAAANGQNDQSPEGGVAALAPLLPQEKAIAKPNNNDQIHTHLLHPLSELVSLLLRFIHLFESIFDSLSPEDYESDTVYKCRVSLRRIKRIAELVNRFPRFAEESADIFWLERQRGYKGEAYCRFNITPLDIAPFMQEAVFEPYETIVFTSATLAINNRFDFWKTRVGLSNGLTSLSNGSTKLKAATQKTVLEKTFASPFDYEKQTLLGIPQDAPAPESSGYEKFSADFIREVLLISEGKALILFTSYSMLNRTYEQVAPALIAAGINVLRQGNEDRARLLARFINDTHSVLFATSSFWEGIDSPGETLQVLILCRLPFSVPTHPVLKARTDAISQRGGNPFIELSLPDAIIKLKQGFGRLIRRKSDCGVVLILDSRILSKSYGKLFIDSLPPARLKVTNKKLLLEEVENFLIRINQS